MMKYPDFSDSGTRSGTLAIVAVGTLILSAPFVAQAVTSNAEPELTEVSAGGATLRDTNGAPLQCAQKSANSSDGVTGRWRWDCDDTSIEIRTDYTADVEAERTKTVARFYWQITSGESVSPNELEHPAPNVYELHRNGVSLAAVERGDITIYVAAADDRGREIVNQFVQEEVR